MDEEVKKVGEEIDDVYKNMVLTLMIDSFMANMTRYGFSVHLADNKESKRVALFIDGCILNQENGITIPTIAEKTKEE